MAGINKLLKQAEKMQKQMQALQADLGNEVLDLTFGGGAVTIKIDGHGKIQGFAIDAEFLKEDASTVNETALGALQQAQEKASALSSQRMQSLTGGMDLGAMGGGLPGLF